MERLSKQTQNIWREYIDAFLWLGKEFKTWVYLNDLDFKNKRNLLNYYTLLMEYKDIDDPHKNEYVLKLHTIRKVLTTLIRMIVKNEVIALEDYKDMPWVVWVTICKNNDISDIFPSMLWPNYKQYKKSFRYNKIKDYCLDYIFTRVMNMRIYIKFNHNLIDIYSIVGRTYRINDSEIDNTKKKIDKILAACPTSNWKCKPEKLEICYSDEQIISEVKRFPYFSSIKEIDLSVRANSEDLHQLLILSKNFDNIPLYLNIYTLHDVYIWNYNVILFQKYIPFVLRGSAYFFETSKDGILNEIECHQEDLVNEEELVQIKLIDACIERLKLAKKVWANSGNSSILNNLKEITKLSNDVYIVANKQELGIKIELETFLKDIKLFKNYKQIIIDFNNIDENIIDIFEKLKDFLTNLEYKFIITHNPKQFFESEIFMNQLKKFKRWDIETETALITILTNNSGVEENISDLKFSMRTVGKYRIINYQKLLEIL